MLTLSFSSWGQSHSLTKADYQHKAKSQQTLAWVMLSSGFVSTTIGIIAGTKEVELQLYNLFSFEEPRKQRSVGAWFVVGGTLMVSSIPLFISASKNKQKATSAFFKMESQPLVRQGSFVKSSYPAIALKINL